MLRELWYYLWIAPHLLLGAVLLLMVRRRAYRLLPIFFSYVAFEAIQFAVLFVVRQSHAATDDGYVQFYAVGLAVSAALRFGVILEVFGQLFSRNATLSKPARTFGRWATLVLLGLAVVLAEVSPGAESDLLKHTIHGLDRAVSILQCGLLISLLVFSHYFALSAKRYAFGAALGFGILASVELATSAIRLYGIASYRVCDFVTMGTYHVCVLLWIYYFWKQEEIRQPHPSDHLPKLPAEEVEQWNRELERLLQ